MPAPLATPAAIDRPRERLWSLGPALAIESYALAVVGAWVGAADPTVAEARRPAALAMAESLPNHESRRDALARIARLDGLLGASRGDGTAVAAARRAVSATGFSGSTVVERSLAAFDAARRGDHERAGGLLARLEEECAAAETCNEFTPAIAVNRLAAAEWLAASGRLERARRLLRYQEARSYPNWLYLLNDVLAAPTLLARARLEERIGDRQRATEYYERFLQMYDRPVPRLAHTRDEAAAALARISVGRGAGPR